MVAMAVHVSFGSVREFHQRTFAVRASGRSVTIILELFGWVLLLLLLAVFVLGAIFLCLVLIRFIRDELQEMKEDSDGNLR